MKDSKFQIYRGQDEQFYFRLRSSNGEIILSSEGYVSKSGCSAGINSVKQNSALDSQFKREISKDNNNYFVLISSNGEIIGASEIYSSDAARDKGIDAVRDTASNAPVEDLTL